MLRSERSKLVGDARVAKMNARDALLEVAFKPFAFFSFPSFMFRLLLFPAATEAGDN